MRAYVIRLAHNLSKLRWYQKRTLSEGSQLIGRDFINPAEFTSSEIKTLLWTAIELKSCIGLKELQIHSRLKNYNATVVLNQPLPTTQVALSNALSIVGCNVTSIVDEHWETSCDVAELGRGLSRMTNIIFAHASDHESIINLSNGASVPVINLGSSRFKPVHVLAQLISVQEHYGYLRRLKLGWVGPANSLFNAFLITAPKLGMHIQYVCTENPEEPGSPDLLASAMKDAITENSQIREYSNVNDALYRVHIIATTKHNLSSLQINNKIVSEADLNWTLMHDLPRTKLEITDDVFSTKNSLVWNTCENLVWALMALSVQHLSAYKPSISCPDFDGEIVALNEKWNSKK